jgi:hypothetical protein
VSTTLTKTIATTDGGRRRRRLSAGAAVAAIALIIAIIAVATDDPDGTSADPGAEPLELSLGAGDTLGSCVVFDVAFLAQMTPAFAATATAVDGETVVLTVDRWYAGDPGTDVVELAAPSGLEALIGGFPFTVGQQYLITAADGTVNYCGYSGPATTELTEAFQQAFGA